MSNTSSPAKPLAPPLPNPANVPPQLRLLKRWLGWSYQWKDEKWTKQPVSPLTGQFIGVTSRGTKGQDWASHWTDFDGAVKGASGLKLDGVGFVFTKEDGFLGIDFDNCRDGLGKLHPAVSEWIGITCEKTYAEVSPSKTGVHIIGKAQLHAPGNKKPFPGVPEIKVEFYDDARFFTYTGLPLGVIRVADYEAQAGKLHHYVFGDEPTAREELPIKGNAHEFMTDERIIKRLTSTKKWANIFDKGARPQEFVAQHYKGDDSSADLAFCALVSRYTMNPGQVDRLWRLSMLWRDKSAQRDDYRMATINRAMTTTASTRAPLVDTSVKTEVTWLWPQRFPRGKLVLMDGDPGLSKSMFALAVAVSVMTDKPFLDGSKPEATGGVVLLSAEDDLRDTIVPRLVAAGAPDGQRIPLIHIPSTKLDGTQFSLADPDDRLELEMMVAHVDAKLVIIDPLNAYLGDKLDSHNDQKIRQVLGPLSEIANHSGAVVLCLRHLAKSGGGKAIYRGMGSIGYTAAARANYFVAEHPEEKDTFVFAASKFNLGPKPQSLKYRLAFATVTGISKPVPHVASGEPCSLTANDLAAAQNKEAEGDKLGEAVEFLKLMLAEGPIAKTEIEKKADKQKISPMTLRRAREALKVKPYQEAKKWWWKLPEGMVIEIPF